MGTVINFPASSRQQPEPDAMTRERAERNIRVMSKVVAEMMADIHGDKWIAYINHTLGYVLIKPEVV